MGEVVAPIAGVVTAMDALADSYLVEQANPDFLARGQIARTQDNPAARSNHRAHSGWPTPA
ncbi:MAG: hypothetical protein WCI02_07995 [Planctomycetota bacterium]